MNWNIPKIVEVALGAEINCYACAELEAPDSTPGSALQSVPSGIPCTMPVTPA
jgi:coenzyme PQQ precursor peptide PqqA